MTNVLLLGLLLAVGVLAGGVVWLARRTAAAPDTNAADEARASEMRDRFETLHRTMEQARDKSDEKLSELKKTLSDDMAQHREKLNTNLADNLGRMNERLTVIQEAEKNIAALTQETHSLKQILDNPQRRGAFGEVLLENLVSDMMPAKDYTLQHTLSNGRRVDCLIHMPHPPGPVPVDSKFPLEAWKAMASAQDASARKSAQKALQAALLQQASEIAERYILPGETADSAVMFLPSESVYAELHIEMADAMQKCRALRVYPASPNTLAMALNTLRAVVRDVEMHAQARLIQNEIGALVGDVGRLDARVGDLRRHFDAANKDIQQIETSRDKILRRGTKIEEVEFDTPTETQETSLPPPAPPPD